MFLFWHRQKEQAFPFFHSCPCACAEHIVIKILAKDLHPSAIELSGRLCLIVNGIMERLHLSAVFGKMGGNEGKDRERVFQRQHRREKDGAELCTSTEEANSSLARRSRRHSFSATPLAPSEALREASDVLAFSCCCSTSPAPQNKLPQCSGLLCDQAATEILISMI